MDFWDDKQGVALSDGIDGIFPLLITRNGKDWGLLSDRRQPALPAGRRLLRGQRHLPGGTR